MPDTTHTLLLILVMAGVTAALRFLPFWVLGKREPPRFILYLGRVLPFAVMGMLVVYCLKDTEITNPASLLPVLLAGGLTVLLQAWKHNTLVSIIAGTAVYMLLVQLVFI